MEFIISQLCGFVVSLVVFLSMQLKNVKHILVCQLVCNGLGALSYILLGGFSGCGIYIAALVQSAVYYFFSAKKIKPPVFAAIAFVCVYLMCSAATYKGFEDVISAVAALTCALALAQSKSAGYRIFMLLNGILWIVYDVSVSAYGMMISHIVTVLSAAVGIIRLDIKSLKNQKPRIKEK